MLADVSRAVRAPTAYRQPFILAALAVLCVGLVLAAHGVPRFVAGLVLCLYLPGRLAVLALFGRPVEAHLGAVLTATLSLAATMLVGMVGAAMRRLDAGTLAIGVLALCWLFAGIAFRRRSNGPTEAADARSNAARDLLVGRHVMAGLPLVALAALLAVQIADAVRFRPPDSYYTELSIDTSDPLRVSVVVRSRERDTTAFHYEERLDGAVVRAGEFSLRPQERREIAVVPSSAGVVEVVLYKSDHSAPYRRVIL